MKIRLYLPLLLLLIAGYVSSQQPIAQFDLSNNLNDKLNPTSQLNFHSNLTSPQKTKGRFGQPAFKCNEGDYYSLPSNNIDVLNSTGTFTISLWVKLEENNPLSSDIINVKLTSSNNNVSEIRISDNQVKFGLKTVDFSQKIVFDSFQDIALVLANHDQNGKQIDVYLQGHLILREYIDVDFQIQDIQLGKQFNGIISDVLIYKDSLNGNQVKQIEDPDFKNDFSSVFNTIRSYYPLHDGKLNDLKWNSPNLELESELKLSQDKFGLPDRAIRLFNSEIKLKRINIEIFNSNKTTNQEYTVSFQGYRESPLSKGEYLFKVWIQSSTGLSGYMGMGYQEASDYIQTNKWQTYSITFKAVQDSIIMNFYVDHYLVDQQGLYFISGMWEIYKITFGNIPSLIRYDSLNYINDIIIHKKALSKYEVSYITDLEKDLLEIKTTTQESSESSNNGN